MTSFTPTFNSTSDNYSNAGDRRTGSIEQSIPSNPPFSCSSLLLSSDRLVPDEFLLLGCVLTVAFGVSSLVKYKFPPIDPDLFIYSDGSVGAFGVSSRSSEARLCSKARAIL